LETPQLSTASEVSNSTDSSLDIQIPNESTKSKAASQSDRWLPKWLVMGLGVVLLGVVFAVGVAAIKMTMHRKRQERVLADEWDQYMEVLCLILADVYACWLLYS
jgi:hypothetical protein